MDEYVANYHCCGPEILLICGDPFTEKYGVRALCHFWFRPEFEYLTILPVPRTVALTHPHARQGSIGIYGFYLIDNPDPDMIDGLPFLLPYLALLGNYQGKAFYLLLSETFACLTKASLSRDSSVKFEELCTIKFSIYPDD